MFLELIEKDRYLIYDKDIVILIFFQFFQNMMTCLHHASKSNYFELLKLIMEFNYLKKIKVDINAIDIVILYKYLPQVGRNALYYAARG